jgi:PIN domain nuclease of toxin-antitoxin system
MTYVLDTSAVMAFFLDETGAEEADRILRQTEYSCHIHAVNWIEVFYKMREKGNDAAARSAVDELNRYGVTVVDVAVETFRLRVAEIKIAHPFLALGDCFAIGLAGWLQGEVVTADKIFERAKAFADVKRIR